MGYTKQELEISNKSYTNKDFNTIYPELLDLVGKMTNKWDPTSSNESDPGVVLLKLWSLLIDKNNYNIDKNILEAFPLSVTQRANAQKLYDMLGYNMHYYKSAITNITLWYTGAALNKDPDTGRQTVTTITIPKFTMVTDDSGENTFTLLENVIIAYRASPVRVKAIQGTIHDYEVNGVTDITLDNLDSEYRLFFNEYRIAENGIFITNKGLGNDFIVNEWERTNNLESSSLNRKVYKFGVLPTTQTCYIQFPQDIGNLIGNGLSIKYIITDGANGNVQANKINTIKNEIIPKEFASLGDVNSAFYNTSINSDITLQNIDAATNGADPENLDDAYKNYKKTIGTFNTLVTLEDYEKAIYNLTNTLGEPYCSNVVASDRTNNFNFSTEVIEFNNGEDEKFLKIKENLIKTKCYNANGEEIAEECYIKSPKLSAFDICLHILSPMVNFNDTTGRYYNKSFSSLKSSTGMTSYSSYAEILKMLEDYQAINHDFINIVNDNITEDYSYLHVDNGKVIYSSTEDTKNIPIPYIFKNFYTLNGKILTYYKVTEDEAKEIEKNVKLALFKNYNAREVAFGEPILYDDIVATIESADTRIKSVLLNEPEYNLKYMENNDITGSFTTAKNLAYNGNAAAKAIMTELLEKMIVSGHVQLYNFNEDINFDFGQSNLTKYSNVTTITTKNEINVITPKSGNGGSSINNDNGVFKLVDSLGNVIGICNSKIANDGTTQYIDVTMEKSPGANESFQLYAPNFYTSTIYSSYVNYLLGDNNIEYKAGIYYKLTSPIYLEYTNDSGVSRTETLPIGTCIRFMDSSNGGEVLKNKTDSNYIVKDLIIDGKLEKGKKMGTLSASQQLEVLKVNEVIFSASTYGQSFLNCLWFTNNSETNEDGSIKYTLFKENETTKILQENEYFMYTNNDKNELIILGSGTLLTRESTLNRLPKLEYISTVTTTAILEDGQKAIPESSWYRYSLKTNSLSLVDLQIITLSEGAGIKFTIPFDINGITYDSTNGFNKELTLSSVPIKVTAPQYCEEYSTDQHKVNNWVSLDEYEIETNVTSNYYKGWSLISNLGLSLGKIYPQELSPNNIIEVTTESTSNDDGGVIKLTNTISGTTTDGKSTNILMNSPLITNGGEGLNISSLDNSSINFYTYSKVDLPRYYDYDTTGDYTLEFERDATEYINISWKNWNRTSKGGDNYVEQSSREELGDTFELTFEEGSKNSINLFVALEGEYTKVELIFNGDTANVITLTPNENKYYYSNKDTNRLTLKIQKFIIISEANGSDVNDILKIGTPKILSNNSPYSSQVINTLEQIYSEDIKNSGVTVTDYADTFTNKLKINYINFNPNYIIKSEDMIDGKVGASTNYDKLFTGEAVWDRNHICNKFTIPQLNTTNSSITVAQTSIKK